MIRLENIGKCYRIYANPQDRFKQAFRDRLGRWLGKQAPPPLFREHWALRGVSFEVATGEAVGILGRNGAGKSTLLQIIAGTLSQTTGELKAGGRITAMLELGSGFNPDFTGRENVFHNAQILGLSRSETAMKFGAIEEFADIGDFIDQPVKTYSSGMMMRLAFAVQTVMDPAILIVDEALSVGDARFQEKCFRKLRELREKGVSILLVTHDVNAVTMFCDRAVLMDGGEVLSVGDPISIAKQYLQVLYSDTKGSRKGIRSGDGSTYESSANGREGKNVAMSFDESSGRFGNRKVEILSVGIFTPDGQAVRALSPGGKYRITQRVRVNEDVDYLSTGFMVRTTKSVDIFGASNKSLGQDVFLHLTRGEVLDISMDIDNWLSGGEYILHAANAGEDGVQYDCIPSALSFTVIGTPEIYTTSVVNLCPSISIAKSDLYLA
ncbi:ABC transporter ATP-binding protein [Halothiobacillus sp. DCM-1]|uniref:ABC transporter ATP-binding protein n=1 Tax=Halothiobacillus sp. DCM-1 TaxID=3112558 RepID=UPI00324DCC90